MANHGYCIGCYWWQKCEPQPTIKMRDTEVGVCWFQSNDLMTKYKTHADSYCPDYYAAKHRRGLAIIEKRYKN